MGLKTNRYTVEYTKICKCVAHISAKDRKTALLVAKEYKEKDNDNFSVVSENFEII